VTLPLVGMPDSHSVDDEARHKTQLERLDRNLEEMTGELRVVVTGVQASTGALPFAALWVCAADQTAA
jgi:hypothetical protein